MLNQIKLQSQQIAAAQTAEIINLYESDPWTRGQPTDEEICQMAEWYADQNHGSYVLLSDSLDHGWN